MIDIEDCYCWWVDVLAKEICPAGDTEKGAATDVAYPVE